MKRKILFAVVVVCALAPLFSIDFGGRISSTTKYQGVNFSSLKWYESAKVHLWLTQQFNENLRLSSDISYEFRYDQNADAIKNIIDVNLLKLTGTFHRRTADTIEFGVGRFAVSDATGVVFNQVNDGIFAKVSVPAGSISAYAGITRLLNSHDTVILRQDSDTIVPTSSAKALYVLGPKYIPLGFTLSLTPLFLNQTFTAEEWIFLDYSDDRYYRSFWTFMLSGPLARNVFYTASTTIGSENLGTVSNLSKFALSYFPVKNATVGFNALYASGNNGSLSAFRGFTSQTAVLATETVDFSTEYEGKLKFGVSGSYMIASRVYLGADCTVVFSCFDTLAYNGFQWQFNVMWNIFHDLQLSAGMYQYVAQKNENNKTCFLLTGTFVF